MQLIQFWDVQPSLLCNIVVQCNKVGELSYLPSLWLTFVVEFTRMRGLSRE
jgi:hypothetical protein